MQRAAQQRNKKWPGDDNGKESLQTSAFIPMEEDCVKMRSWQQCWSYNLKVTELFGLRLCCVFCCHQSGVETSPPRKVSQQHLQRAFHAIRGFAVCLGHDYLLSIVD